MRHPWRSPDKTNGLRCVLSRLRDGPLMDIGLRHAEPARPDRSASPAVSVRRVAVSPRASFPPSSRSSSCLWLVGGAINLRRGLSPLVVGHVGRTRIGRARCRTRPSLEPDVHLSMHEAPASPGWRGRDPGGQDADGRKDPATESSRSTRCGQAAYVRKPPGFLSE